MKKFILLALLACVFAYFSPDAQAAGIRVHHKHPRHHHNRHHHRHHKR